MNDMMKRAKGEGIERYSKSKPDFHAKGRIYMMGGSGLIGFPQILKGLEAEGHPGLREQFWSLRGGRLRYEGHAKDSRHWDGRYFGLAEWITVGCCLYRITKSGARYRPLLVGSNGAEG